MTANLEKRALQVVMAMACLVPIVAGAVGIWRGTSWLDDTGADLDSHFRYLSGLLLGIGLAFAMCIPRVETNTVIVRLLTLIVIAGGVGRAIGFKHAVPSAGMCAALVMELVIAPLLCLWQSRIASRSVMLSAAEMTRP